MYITKPSTLCYLCTASYPFPCVWEVHANRYTLAGARCRVAAVYLGMRPKAIMLLKRQGERPFEDSLTLEDYEISNGSSLDLEIDTCDL